MIPVTFVALALWAGSVRADSLIVIDPGHGGYDPGAVGNGLYEDELNLEAGLAFRDWLELDSSDTSGGGRWDVYMTRESDTYVELSSRCDYANSLGADYFMSIHTNAGGGDGTETYAYASGGTADSLAHDVQDEILDHLGTRDRGVKYESFYVLVNTSMPADLAEMAFIDTWSGNAELLSDPANLDAVGLAHLHAIQRQTGLASYTPSDDTDPGEPTGRVWLEDVPGSLESAEAFTVTVGYQTDLHSFGERGELGLRMVDAGQWNTLDEQSWDNGGVGIQGPEGEYAFELEAPSGVEAVIFIAWMSPLGAGWDERFDDANSSSSPTTVGGDEPVDTGEPPSDGELELLGVPGFVVVGQPFEIKVRHGEGVWDGPGSLGVELVEYERGLVAQSQSIAIEQVAGTETIGVTYDGPSELIWFHVCAYEDVSDFGAGRCLAEDSSESSPTRVMQGRERFTDGGCACSSPGRRSGEWIMVLLAVLGLVVRRRGSP